MPPSLRPVLLQVLPRLWCQGRDPSIRWIDNHGGPLVPIHSYEMRSPIVKHVVVRALHIRFGASVAAIHIGRCDSLFFVSRRFLVREGESSSEFNGTF